MPHRSLHQYSGTGLSHVSYIKLLIATIIIIIMYLLLTISGPNKNEMNGVLGHFCANIG